MRNRQKYRRSGRGNTQRQQPQQRCSSAATAKRTAQLWRCGAAATTLLCSNTVLGTSSAWYLPRLPTAKPLRIAAWQGGSQEEAMQQLEGRCPIADVLEALGRWGGCMAAAPWFQAPRHAAWGACDSRSRRGHRCCLA